MTDESTDRAHERVGETLNDKWTLETLLGVGGMGSVYSGLHRNGARAAVKVLHRYLARHEELRGRFLREGYAANRVEHPGVVKVLDDDIVSSGPDEGTAYLVMELLEGESLETRVGRGLAVTERDFLLVAEAVLEVLEVAHHNGVVHRDIKPDNIFVTKDAEGKTRIKVLDFGLAKVLEGQSTTLYGVALGTPSFMSPEQAAGRNDEVDGRTDLFALAATGFRLVTGLRVHEGANPVEVVMKMGDLPAPRVRTVAPNVSEPFARIIDRALEFRREDRYPDAASMRTDVQRALTELGEAPPPMAPAPAIDRSIELSTSDLEVLQSMHLTPDPTLPPETAPSPPPSSSESTLRLGSAERAAPTAAAPGGTEVRRETTVRITPQERIMPAVAAPPAREATLRLVREPTLAEIPMTGVPLRPALVTLGIMCAGVGIASVAGWIGGAGAGSNGDSGATSPEQAVAPSASTEAPADAGRGADAQSAVAVPGAETSPARHPPQPSAHPWSAPTPGRPQAKPFKHPKH